MHPAFRDIDVVGSGKRRVLVLHGRGGRADGIAKIVSERFGCTAVMPLAKSGKAWLTDAEVLSLFFNDNALAEIVDGLAELLDTGEVDPYIVAYSQGTLPALTLLATRPQTRVDLCVASCGGMPGALTGRRRYPQARKRKHPVTLFLAGHRHDDVAPYAFYKAAYDFFRTTPGFTVFSHLVEDGGHNFIFDEARIRAFAGRALIDREAD